MTLALTALAIALAIAPSSSTSRRSGARERRSPSATTLRGSVDLEGAHGLAIRPPDPPPPAGPHATQRTIAIERVEGGVRITATWQLAAARAGWYADTLLGPGAHIERLTIGGVRATGAGSEAGTLAIARVDGASTIELVAFVPGDPARTPLPLVLAPAVRGTLELVDMTGVRVELADGKAAPRRGAIHFGAPGAIVLAPAPIRPKDDSAPVVVGQVGLGVTVGDAEVRTHARLRWELRRGHVATVAVRIVGMGDDVEVKGPLVRTHRVEGDRIVVELEAAQSHRIDLDVRWSKPTPRGEAVLDLPTIELEDVTRTELAVEIARDGDVDVVPELPGWTATAPQAMPAWGRDLIEGSATAAFRARGDAQPGTLALLRFVPVPGPPAVIQRALVRVVATTEGRALVQVRWELANERKPHLRVVLPKGARLLAIEAAGRDVRPARDRDAWLVPVPRSLETVEGLVSVPVVLTFLLARAPWDRRERREIELPTVDAPISEVEVQLHLPHGYKSRMKPGQWGVTSTIRAADAAQPAVRHKSRWGARGNNVAGPQGSAAPSAVLPDAGDDLERATADRILRDATDAYQRNEFEHAQGKLDELRQRGLEDDDADRLQSNLDVVNAPDDGEEAPVVGATLSGKTTIETKRKAGIVRRVREQAKARAGKKVSDERAHRDRARRLRSEGKYGEAADEYREALKANKDLKKLEQDESSVYDFAEDEIEGELKEVETESKQAEAMQKLVDPAWLSIGEPAEHGFGSPTLAWHSQPVPAPAPTRVAPPLDDGPHVIMPIAHVGDTIVYRFDLWAEGTRHALVVRARRRLELPPP